MTRQAIIERTLKAINQLPEDKAEEISDFADFVIKRFEDHKLTEAIQHMTSNSKGFEFLEEDEDLYTLADLKEVYNG
jgi:superfamily I DNA/RNA helicase